MDHPDAGICYFSGTAVYRCKFPMGNSKPRIFLDLGRVEVIAEIWLNRKSLGTLWKPPFRCEVTDALRQLGYEHEVAGFEALSQLAHVVHRADRPGAG